MLYFVIFAIIYLTAVIGNVVFITLETLSYNLHMARNFPD